MVCDDVDRICKISLTVALEGVFLGLHLGALIKIFNAYAAFHRRNRESCIVVSATVSVVNRATNTVTGTHLRHWESS